VSARPDVLASVVASGLLAPLVDGPRQSLHVVHRSRVAWQLADGRGRVVLSVITPSAVRLPHAAVVSTLPRGSSPISAGGGSLEWDGSQHKVTRWFRPAQPILPHLQDLLDPAAVAAFARRWPDRVGQGDGLTPYHDDVVCGGLVVLRAAAHPAADAVAGEIDERPLEQRTTALSAALLRMAARGYCIDPLARFLRALATADGSADGAADLDDAFADLVRVGHSSGRGLAEGVSRLLRSDAQVGAAA
jgi:hypothetical protein